MGAMYSTGGEHLEVVALWGMAVGILTAIILLEIITLLLKVSNAQFQESMQQNSHLKMPTKTAQRRAVCWPVLEMPS